MIDKVCSRCFLAKPLEEFYERKKTSVKNPGTHRNWCKSCDGASNRKHSKAKDDYHKNWKLLRKFGITLEAYKIIERKQHGKCAICGRTPEDDSMKHSLAVDHDHRTNKVRGLLCRHCNIGLGKLGDSVEGLQRAIAYLQNRE